MKKYLHGVSLLILFFCFYSQSASAFDCNKARNYSEESICADQLLLRLDLAMNENFKFMLNSNIGEGARQDLKLTQRAWMSERNKCKGRTCILNSYKKRLGEVCEYPVINGIHPVCSDFDEILNSYNIRWNKQ